MNTSKGGFLVHFLSWGLRKLYTELGKQQAKETKLYQIHQYHLSLWRRLNRSTCSCWLDGQEMTDRHMKEGLKQKVSKDTVKGMEVCFHLSRKQPAQDFFCRRLENQNGNELFTLRSSEDLFIVLFPSSIMTDIKTLPLLWGWRSPVAKQKWKTTQHGDDKD